MLSERSAQYMAVAFVGCVTAALMLVAFDFAGWEESEVTSRTNFRYSADPVNIFRTRVRREVMTRANYYVYSVNPFGPLFVVIAPVVALMGVRRLRLVSRAQVGRGLSFVQLFKARVPYSADRDRGLAGRCRRLRASHAGQRPILTGGRMPAFTERSVRRRRLLYSST